MCRILKSDTLNFPLALIDTGKFTYQRKNIFKIDVILTIKGKNEIVPLELEIEELAANLVQIKGHLNFSRNNFEIGKGKWKSSTILKDQISIKTNLFLFKE